MKTRPKFFLGFNFTQLALIESKVAQEVAKEVAKEVA